MPHGNEHTIPVVGEYSKQSKTMQLLIRSYLDFMLQNCLQKRRGKTTLPSDFLGTMTFLGILKGAMYNDPNLSRFFLFKLGLYEFSKIKKQYFQFKSRFQDYSIFFLTNDLCTSDIFQDQSKNGTQ